MSPSVYIIVLNWNGEKLIQDCLKTLSNIKYTNYQILVVDNNSDDNSVNVIRKEFPNVNILELDKNYGYAEGNNKGFESIANDNPEYVIFLNNDTEVDSNFIMPLVKPLKKNAEIGQTVPKIYYAKDRKKIWYSGGKVNLWLGQIRHIGIRKIDSQLYNESIETDYATGCCFAMRYNDFKEIGGFDSSFPMYCEDVDLSLRVREFGQIIQFALDSRIWHKISSSIGGEFSVQKSLRKFKGHVKLFWKHSNFIQKITIPLSWMLSIPFILFKIIYLRFK